MKAGVYLIFGALAVYLAAVGCAMWPLDSSGGRSAPVFEDSAHSALSANLDALPFRGMSLQVQRIDSPEVYEKAIDDIARLGADTVEIVVDSKQENVSSSAIFIDARQTPSFEKLVSLIQYAKEKRGLRVVLMPLVLMERPGSDWRGKFKPDSWDEWFDSYRQMISHYAAAAEAGHADVFMVGSELVSTEKFADEWVRTIHETRRIFHGLLSYSANWDHYQGIPFWEQLDLISTNSYYKLGEDKDVTVDHIVGEWTRIQKDLLKFIHEKHKPYMFTEVGWCSVANAADEPWDYTQDTVPLDTELQRKLYEGFFKAWDGVPELAGYMIWQWTPNAGGSQDRGYTPAGKPAERILREAFAQPRWKVNKNP